MQNPGMPKERRGITFMNRHEAETRRFWKFSEKAVRRIIGFRLVDSLLDKDYDHLSQGEKHFVQMAYAKFVRDIKDEPAKKTGSDGV